MNQSKPIKPRSHTSSHLTYLSKQLWLLYLHSPQARRSFWLIVLTSREPPKQIIYNRKYMLWRRISSVYSHSRLLKIAAVLSIIVSLQMLYPRDMALPFSRMQAHGYIGFKSKQEVLGKLRDFDTRIVTVHTHNKTITTSYTDLGVRLNPEATFEAVNKYPLNQRLIPFSIFVAGNKSVTLNRNLNEAQLQLYVKDIIAEENRPSVDATVTKESTKLTVKPSEDGYAYQYQVLQAQLLKADLRNRAEIVFSPSILNPRITTKSATTAAEQMQQRINNPLLISAEGNSMTADSTMIAGWVDVAPAPDKGTIDFSFNQAQVAASLRPFINTVNVPMTPTIVTMLNGQQAGFKVGITGKTLQFDDLVLRVTKSTAGFTNTITADVRSTFPTESFDRRYSKDNRGLQNLLDYWQQTHPGQYSVEFASLNGRLQASLNADRPFNGAAINGLFLPHLTMGRINAGSLYNSTPVAGQNVGSCITKVLVSSDSNCTSALGDINGWRASDSQLLSQGFTNTMLINGSGLTSARDTTTWGIKLLENSLTTKPHATTIIDGMSKHNMRQGIPAGSPGMRVANKAGSFGRNRFDIAIVYHPAGTYVLSVMCDGGSYPAMADLAREINKTLNQ